MADARVLDTSSPDVFARWLALPPSDSRTLDEFAAQFGLSLDGVRRGVLGWNGHEHVIVYLETE